MSERRYLYEFDYACGHSRFDTLDRQLSRAEYYAREAGKCPACQAVVDKAAATLSEQKAALLPPPVESGGRWEERRRACPVCGEAKILVETANGVMCRACRKESGQMDGKQGVCDVCGRKITLHYTGAAMVCRHCWEKATGKKAPEDWAKPGPKDGVERKARAAE